MEYKHIMKIAESIEENIIDDYKYLHKCPGIGFDIRETYEYVKNRLSEMGFSPRKCGQSGIIVDIGSGDGKKVLLRADMDGLSIREESGVEYASINGNMHACGHDMHTAMLLAAARIFKELNINGDVRLMFQPAEEILEGAKDMIEDGVLENVKAGVMLHVLPALPFESGTVIVSSAGVGAPSADYFSINIEGVGGHGAMPDKCVSPIDISSHIILALKNIDATVTIGSVQSGTAYNIIPDKAVLKGTMRTFDEKKREEVKGKIKRICENMAMAYGGKATLVFERGCPTLINDENLSCHIEKTMIELLDEKKVFNTEQLAKGNAKSSSGSEDFAYISHEIPTLMLGLVAGNIADGYTHNLHHPKVKFDLEALKYGSAVYVASALCMLKK